MLKRIRRGSVGGVSTGRAARDTNVMTDAFSRIGLDAPTAAARVGCRGLDRPIPEALFTGVLCMRQTIALRLLWRLPAALTVLSRNFGHCHVAVSMLAKPTARKRRRCGNQERRCLRGPCAPCRERAGIVAQARVDGTGWMFKWGHVGLRQLGAGVGWPHGVGGHCLCGNHLCCTSPSAGGVCVKATSGSGVRGWLQIRQLDAGWQKMRSVTVPLRAATTSTCGYRTGVTATATPASAFPAEGRLWVYDARANTMCCICACVVCARLRACGCVCGTALVRRPESTTRGRERERLVGLACRRDHGELKLNLRGNCEGNDSQFGIRCVDKGRVGLYASTPTSASEAT